MEKTKNYSFIIPHKNNTKLLQRCLNSIPKRADVQIIIVDDNSDDSIVDFEKFPGLGEEYVEVVFTKEGKGAGYARNVGIERAKGRWLFFVDSDDFLRDDFLQVTDSYLESDYDIIFFGVNCVNSDNVSEIAERKAVLSLNKYISIYKLNKAKGEYFFRYKFSEPWAKMVRRELILDYNLKFDETIVANDFIFSVKIGYYAKKIHVDESRIYFLTSRDDSLSADFAGSFEKLKTRIFVATEVTLFFNEKGILYKISPLRGLIVILLKKYPFHAFSIFLFLTRKGINLWRLIFDLFRVRGDKFKWL